MRRLSYLAPATLIGLLAWLGQPSWWALAMLTGAAMFAWDYLWGDRRVLDAALYGAIIWSRAWGRDRGAL